MSVPPEQFSGLAPDDDNQAVKRSERSLTPSTQPEQELFDDLTGRTLGGYRIQAKLGGGAMASVYRALDEAQGRTVALKVVLPGADTIVRERFRLEARTVSTLAHPNIVPTLQVGQAGAQAIHYIVMELVEGTTLAEVLEQKRQLSVVDSCKLLMPVARALAYAHEQSVIHRDVKPSNILLRRIDSVTSSPGRSNVGAAGVAHVEPVYVTALPFHVVPLLSDFGIARSLDAPELTSVGRTIGTPAYMAPEQCAGSRQIDGRADIYALGAVLYRCLVGRPPFVGTTTQILHAHVYDPVTIPEELLNQLPALIIEILKKTLAKEPELRYQKASLLADDLRAAANTIDQPAVQYDDLTTTMIALPTVSPPPKTAQVLVPASTNKNIFSEGSAVELTAVKPAIEREAVSPTLLPRPARKPAGRTNWAGVLFGSLLALLPLVVGLIVILSLLPSEGWLARIRNLAIFSATPVAGVVPETLAGTPTVVPTDVALPAETAVASNVVTSTVATNTVVVITGVSTATVVSSLTPTVTPTLGPVPTPSISVPEVWENVQGIYRDRDWATTRGQLILILRTNPTFNQSLATNKDPEGELIDRIFFSDTASSIWATWQNIPDLNPTQMREMLFNIYVGLAAERIGTELRAASAPPTPTPPTPEARNVKVETALDFLDSALAMRPDAEPIRRLRAATATYWAATGSAKPEAATVLGLAHRTYADELTVQQDHCGALEQVAAAAVVAPNLQLDETITLARTACDAVPQAAGGSIAPDKLMGSIFYSTQIGERSLIFHLSLGENPVSQFVVENGTQPRLSPDGKILAFHTTPPDVEGLAGFALDAGLAPTERTIRYTPYVEDGVESPPVWNPTGDRLAFATLRAGDGRSQIYLQPTAPDNTTNSWFYGRSPAWEPGTNGGNRIVYRGTDLTGNQIGLWMASNDGDNRAPLTQVGSDDRPTWSPDGKSIVFISSDRDGNWELYRLLLETGDVTRLTNDPELDVLPSVSPDGTMVAFVSNRGGDWHVWVVPLSGGDPVMIAPLEGALPDWWRNAIHWVK